MFGKLTTALAALAVAVLATHDAAATTTLKIGTLAPGDSAWGKEFKKWAKDVSDDTNGELVLDFQWNGQAGDEVLMVQKMRSGQLDGAAVTAIGLAQTGVTDVLLFQMPGLFANWGKLDSARNAMKPDFDQQFQSKGFTILGWGDVGAAKTMSVGFEVHHPADLQGKGCYFLAGDPVGPKIFQAIGGINAKEVTVPEILPNLTNGSITVLTVPPLAAEQLQWASRLDHMNTMVTGIGIGALVFTSAKIKSLPADAAAALLETGKVAGDALTGRIRREDAAAFARLKGRMATYDPTADEQGQWNKVFADTRARLRGTTFDPAVFDQAVKYAQ
jgi:TRAP-type C4-dicarboxylate transport system substrate-binding protein